MGQVDPWRAQFAMLSRVVLCTGGTCQQTAVLRDTGLEIVDVAYRAYCITPFVPS